MGDVIVKVLMLSLTPQTMSSTLCSSSFLLLCIQSPFKTLFGTSLVFETYGSITALPELHAITFLKSPNVPTFVSALAENYCKCSVIQYLLCHLYFGSLKDRRCLLSPVFLTCELLKVDINDSCTKIQLFIEII